jgi:hypothetical protein
MAQYVRHNQQSTKKTQKKHRTLVNCTYNPMCKDVLAADQGLLDD